MASKHPDHSSASAQQTRLAEDHEIPWLERFLKKIRFFDLKYNFMYAPEL
jgi:TorA maturation chaperone TorD